MADFTISLARMLRHEGGYSNDNCDRGGETYRGIARNFHPAWPGWQIVDSAKHLADFPKSLEQNSKLQSIVVDFYKSEFWDKIAGETISSQPVANELFDCAVNMGVTSAIRILQKSLNNLSPPQSSALSGDGIIGPKTLLALEQWLTQLTLHPAVAANALLSKMLVLRGECYIDIVTRNPFQKQFAYGWFRRIFEAPEIDENK